MGGTCSNAMPSPAHPAVPLAAAVDFLKRYFLEDSEPRAAQPAGRECKEAAAAVPATVPGPSLTPAAACADPSPGGQHPRPSAAAVSPSSPSASLKENTLLEVGFADGPAPCLPLAPHLAAAAAAAAVLPPWPETAAPAHAASTPQPQPQHNPAAPPAWPDSAAGGSAPAAPSAGSAAGSPAAAAATPPEQAGGGSADAECPCPGGAGLVVKSIWVYPIKSCRGMRADAWPLGGFPAGRGPAAWVGLWLAAVPAPCKQRMPYPFPCLWPIWPWESEREI